MQSLAMGLAIAEAMPTGGIHGDSFGNELGKKRQVSNNTNNERHGNGVAISADVGLEGELLSDQAAGKAYAAKSAATPTSVMPI